MSTNLHTRPAGKVKTIALWIVTVLLALLFVFAGAMKFLSPEASEGFAKYGYADWFRVLIAVVEIAAGLALLVPRLAFFAAGALAVVMLGAVYTLVSHNEVPQAATPLVIFVLLLVVGYARRPRTAF